MITLEQVHKNADIQALVLNANRMLASLGYTEHGPRHTGYVSRTAQSIMRELGYDEHMQELAAIAGWIHDVGNAVNRKHHGLTGATLVFPLLRDMGMEMEDICEIIAAIGNHEEENGFPVTPITAAIILADKSDAHRTRVRRGKYDPLDIHDRVNYAIKKNALIVDNENKIIRYEVEMDDTSSVMDFMQIYLSRMAMSERAAGTLGCRYHLIVNGMRINNLNPPGKQP
nr:HD domain-containing protein [bacterium]